MVADDLCERTEDVGVVLFVAVGGRRVVHASGTERLEQRRVGYLPHQPQLRRQLIVETYASQLNGCRTLQLDIERRVRRLPDGSQRLVLIFIVGEEMKLVMHDWPTVCPADLLIRVGNDLLEHGIRGVHRTIPEVSNECS